MNRIWKIKVASEEYTIQLKNSIVLINEEIYKLRTLIHKKSFLNNEYELPIGEKKALLVTGSSFTFLEPELVIDGFNYTTGTPYEPRVLPKWAYLFIVLHALNLGNGAVGALLAVMGIHLTVSISADPRKTQSVKLLLNIGVYLFAVAAIFGIAFLVALITL